MVRWRRERIGGDLGGSPDAVLQPPCPYDAALEGWTYPAGPYGTGVGDRVAASLPVAGAVALQTAVNHVSEAKSGFSRLHDFVRGLASAGVAWPGRGAVTFVYGYSTEVPTRPTHDPGGEVRVVLPQGGEVRLFGGRMAGGRVCASGTCRDLPPFEGVRLDVVLNLR